MPRDVSYSVRGVVDGTVFLVDDNKPGTTSVTNAAEEVYAAVRHDYPGHRVVYRDTAGDWDEIALHPNGAAHFKIYEGENPYE